MSQVNSFPRYAMGIGPTSGARQRKLLIQSYPDQVRLVQITCQHSNIVLHGECLSNPEGHNLINPIQTKFISIITSYTRMKFH